MNCEVDQLQCCWTLLCFAAETKGWFGVPVRQYIGITMVSLNPDIAAELKMINTNFPDVEQGVLVYRVVTGSPAYKSVFVVHWIVNIYICDTTKLSAVVKSICRLFVS